MPFEWLTPALLALLVGVVLWIALRRGGDAAATAALREGIVATVRQDLQRLESTLRDDVQKSGAAGRQELGHSVGEFQRTLLAQQGDAAGALDRALGRAAEQQAQSLRSFGATQADQLRALAQSSDERLREVRATVEARLSALQLDNEKKLESIRTTVDEKLHDTLERRLGENFRQVAERLEQVHAGLGEMRNMARDVGSLNRVLTNVKTRGSFGEWQLGALLEDILQIEQYGKNVETIPGSGARVEFAIKMPGRADALPAWLPVDAKFPREDYERLLDAQERADAVGVATAAKAIDQRLRLEARTIREKYLATPHTTDYAILFVPSEGLYAEVLRRPGLFDSLHRDHRVVVAGPTTLVAILSALQAGHRSVALEKRSAEVWEVLGAVKTEFAKFGDVLVKTKKKLDEASNTIDDAQRRTTAMARQLRNVEALPEQRTRSLLPGTLEDEEPADDAAA